MCFDHFVRNLKDFFFDFFKIFQRVPPCLKSECPLMSTDVHVHFQIFVIMDIDGHDPRPPPQCRAMGERGVILANICI